MSTTTAPLARTLSAATALDAGRKRRARVLLAGLTGPELADGTPDARLARVVAAALLARIDGRDDAAGNLYLGGAGAQPGEMLAAFDVLTGSTPFVRFGYRVANAAIANALASADAVHVVDVGIGMGTQWDRVLPHLGARPGRTTVRLTGVDLPGPAARLPAVAARLRLHAQSTGIPLRFAGLALPMEKLDAGHVGIARDEAVAVNLAFALHHTPAHDAVADPERSRDAVLRRIHGLRPSVLTLVEPDSEHSSLPFLARTEQAVRHYGAVFAALDATVPATSRARRVLEQEFFGRELINVVACEGPGRVERHERRQAWRARLARAGFRPLDVARFRDTAAHGLRLPRGYSIAADAGMLVLRWRRTPLIAASAWMPA